MNDQINNQEKSHLSVHDQSPGNPNTNPTNKKWGINNDYAPLSDVLLGIPEYYRWVEAGPLFARTLNNAEKTGVKFDLQTAMAQHAAMVDIYEQNNVKCHYLRSDPVLHRNFFARDSSAMTAE